MTCVDSNVLLDLAQAEPRWLAWSRARLAEAMEAGGILANDVVYAEVSVGFTDSAGLDAFLGLLGVSLVRSPPEALFLAARAHLEYRRRGGTRTGVLPDVFIGADAAVRGVPLLTRDAARYRTCFPELHLIAPG